jgi:hypothetical protein
MKNIILIKLYIIFLIQFAFKGGLKGEPPSITLTAYGYKLRK